VKLEQLANALELQWAGDGDADIQRLADIHSTAKNNSDPASHSGNHTDRHTEGTLSFVTHRRYSEALQASTATAVIVPESLVELAPGNVLISSDPYLSYAKASQLLYPGDEGQPGIHPTAVVDERAQVDSSSRIGANTVVEAGAVVGADCLIGAGSFVGRGTRIGARTRLLANVVIMADCRVGEDCRMQPGVVIGSDGFGYAPSSDGWVRINQIGSVVIGDGVEIGANTTIDRGAITDTVIGDGVILDNQIQIAHNVRLGDRTAIAGCVGIAGSTVVGKQCRIGGKSAIVGHLDIADNVVITAHSFVTRSIKQAGIYSSGMPVQENSAWKRSVARLSRLDELFRRVRKLEQGDR